MKYLLFVFTAIFLNMSVGQANAAGTLKEFVSDGCTMFSNGTSSQPQLWAHCCFEHDLRYWFGGTQDNIEFADLELKACVKKVAGATWAEIIYRGVLAGHDSPIKSKYSWSWGWTPARENTPLTVDEIQYIKSELDKLPLDANYRDAFIQKYLN